MDSTVQLTGLLGVSSPPLAQSHCYSRSGARKQSCSLRAPRRQGMTRLRAVGMGAPGGEPPAAAPEQVEEPSVDFAFVSVSSLLSPSSISRRRGRRCALLFFLAS